jgi:hypothetical protein
MGKNFLAASERKNIASFLIFFAIWRFSKKDSFFISEKNIQALQQFSTHKVYCTVLSPFLALNMNFSTLIKTLTKATQIRW